MNRWDDSSSESSVYELEDGSVSIADDIPHSLRNEYIPGSVIYPIKLLDRGSTYQKILHDVEGNVLTSIDGSVKLNVYTKEMKESIENGDIRVIHCLIEPTYWYFVTSSSQLERFKTRRKCGAPRKYIYHVYADHDVDRTTAHYHKTFISAQKASKKPEISESTEVVVES